ncbi:hypothetical protein Tco_1575142 [Tanacetum coccineum]
MNDDLEYVKSLEKEVDELESEKADFSNIYDLLLEECVSKDVTCSYLHSLSDLNANTELQCLYLHKVKECECLAQKLSKQTESVNKEVHNNLLKSFSKLEKHSISLELALQQCKEQMKNNSVCKENGSNVFRKEREQYHEIQDLKAQMQDKNIAISELKKLIENCKGKSVETQFNKPSVVRQPNAHRIPKPSVLGKPTPFSNSPEMRSFQTKQSVNKTNVSDGLFKQVTQQNLPQIRKQAVRNTNVIAPGPSRNCPKHVSHQSPREKVGSNDMVHNYYLEKAKKSAQLQKDKSEKSQVHLRNQKDRSHRDIGGSNWEKATPTLHGQGTSFNGQKQQRIDITADALYNEKQENLRVWLLKFQDDAPFLNVQKTFDRSRSSLGLHGDDVCSHQFRPPEKTDLSQQGLEFLFSPLLEEYYNPTHGLAEENNNDQAPNASFQEAEFINPFCTRVQEIEQVRGNPSMPVQTRRQLATDPEMCMFALTVSIVEPKNIKEAMADSAWIEAMQDELHQFDRVKLTEEGIDVRRNHMLSCSLRKQFGFLLPTPRTQVFSNLSDDVKKQHFVMVTEKSSEKLVDELSNFLMSKRLSLKAKYALEILKKHNMDNCHSIGTPLATKPKLDEIFAREPSFSTMIMLDALILRKALLEGIKFSGEKLVTGCQETKNCTAMSSAEAGHSNIMQTPIEYQLADIGLTKSPSEGIGLSLLSEGDWYDMFDSAEWRF